MTVGPAGIVLRFALRRNRPNIRRDLQLQGQGTIVRAVAVMGIGGRTSNP